MKKERLSFLLGYILSQEEEVKKIYREIQNINPEMKEKTIYLAYNLHNLYNASFFHKEILKRMSIEIPGIRPKVLSKESFIILNELRGFRYIFRHAYNYEIIPEKVNMLKEKITKNWSIVEEDLNNFKNWLKENLR
ncbi:MULTISPECIES: hypothetical protein [Dictyoglomus]|jgi:hypothetical protein|uniref:HepT-like domain-containing protein n=1 Tax=Dictyoglomus turgidum (strain DSM 6724 / Z-1310) TaxID=515635 RepID=B8DZ13_DICTD|nr:MULTISPECIES: hypothetical protein [Dictyoglomus]ACK41639.1 conserved hypothetical protein [Dictyoglomus turgidum DSM 6724]HBU32027.1 hypothetical protein [Dictyoglomus sp.]